MVSSSNLFKSNIRPFSGPKPRLMPLYEFYSRSDKQGIIKMRNFWETVFRNCRLSKSIKSHIYKRFQSKKNSQHLSAIFELFLYEFLHQIGCKVRGEPPLKGGKPDYKVIWPEGSNFFLEATCRIGSEKKTNRQRWMDIIYDTVNSIESNKFRVSMDYKGETHKAPKVNEIKKRIKEWLETLDYVEILRLEQERKDIRAIPSENFQFNGLEVILRPIPMSPPTSSNQHGLIMWGPSEDVRLVKTGEFMWKKLSNKRKQIAGARLPVMIAINECGDWLDYDEILKSLFGNLNCHYSFSKRTPELISQYRGPSGIWRYKSVAQNSKISGVMFFGKIDFFLEPSQKPAIVLNPYNENNRIPKNLPLFDYFIPKRNGLVLSPISQNWKPDDTEWRKEWPFKNAWR